MGIDRDQDKSGGCFGCGTGNRRGLGLRFVAAGERVEAETVLDPDLCGYGGLAHGGVVATLLDEAMGWAILELAGRFAVTRSLQVEYRRPVAVGRPLTIRAWLGDEAEAGTVHVLAEVRDSRGRVLAAGRAEWSLIRSSRGANVLGAATGSSK